MSRNRCIPYGTTGNWISLLDGTIYTPVIPDNFLPRVTEPVCVDPLNPQPTDNVGWDGDSSGGVMGDSTQPTALTVIVPANTTWSNRKIYANVELADSTSRLENCIVFGGAYATNKPGLVMWAAGGFLDRCTIWGTPKSVNWYTNGHRGTGGTLITNRCVIMRCVDAARTSTASARWIDYGSLITRFAFFDNDQNQSKSTPAFYTHNDGFQASAVATLRHELHGTKIDSYFDTTGVTWSGGAWGVGTASGGEIGMPSTALNAGYWNAAGKGTWCNGITLSGASGHNVLIDGIWIDGVNASSGMVQFTVGDAANPNRVEITGGSRFGLGGKPSGSGKFYMCSWPSSTIAVIGTGADAPVFADLPSVPPALRGTPITFTATGANIIP